MSKSITKYLFYTFLPLMIVLLINTTPVNAKEITLKIAHVQPPTSRDQMACQFLKKIVEKETNGEIKIAIYPAAQLGKIPVQREGVIAGSIDMGLHSLDHWGVVNKNIQALEYPFLFPSRESKRELMETDIFIKMKNDLMKSKNVMILAYNLERGPFKVVLTKEPVFSLQDFKGLKFRLPKLKAFFSAWGAIGVMATPTAWAEVYLALKQNVVAGLEIPFSLIYPNKLYEVAPFVLMSKHLYQNSVIVMNKNKFESLSKSQQNIMKKSSIETGKYYTKIEASAAIKDKKLIMEKGAKIIEIYMKPFFDKVRPSYLSYANEAGWEIGLAENVLSKIK